MPTQKHREESLIAWLRESLARRNNTLIGDDAAVLSSKGRLVVTVDQQILGTHFTEALAPELVARRLLTVNLSDLAAMGARGRFALLALSCPPQYEARRFLRGFVKACDAHKILLAGGDIGQSSTVTAALTLFGDLPGNRLPLLRSRARSGDSVWIGGTVGESALGRLLVQRGARLQGRSVVLPLKLRLGPYQVRGARRAVRRHLQPSAQTELGQWLVMQNRAAAIDISDGLSLDLSRLCRESKLGAEISGSRLPLAQQAQALASLLGESALELALAGGEDYVLLFALPPNLEPPTQFKCVRIGKFTRDRDLIWRDASGRHPLLARGWDQLAE